MTGGNPDERDEAAGAAGEVELTEADRAPEAPAQPSPEASPTPADEIAALNDKILRLAAELENTRRRADRERVEASRYAVTSFARDLLAVADTFERALASAPEGGEAPPEAVAAFVSGIRMTERELLSVLERFGVRRIAPKGEKFDPNLHQAVASAPGDAPAGHVLDVAQPGYVIGERVLRAAMVVVSTGPAAEPAGETLDQAAEKLGAERARFDRRA